MKLIKNAKEFKKFYPYKSAENGKELPEKEDYPKRYPCFCDVYHIDYGGMAEHMEVEIVYPPKGCDLKSFEMGLKEGITLGINIY